MGILGAVDSARKLAIGRGIVPGGRVRLRLTNVGMESVGMALVRGGR